MADEIQPIVGGQNGKQLLPDKTWREQMQRRWKFDDEAQARFLAVYSKTGRKYQAAAAAGVCEATVTIHIRDDEEFRLAYKEAKACYRDRVMQAVYEQAVEGVEEPIMGGKYKDTVVATRRIFAPNLLALEAKRVEPDYREKSAVDVNLTGGVLLVPATMTPEEWELKHGQAQRSLEAPAGESDELP